MTVTDVSRSRRLAHKVRVHELAKELGVSVRDLLATLSKEGVVVRSGSSTIERSIAQRVRAARGIRNAAGITYVDLASELGVAERTVKEVVQQVIRKSVPPHALLSDQIATEVRRRIPVSEQTSSSVRDRQLASGPEYVLLAEDGSVVSHHRNYLDEGSGQALCGYGFGESIALTEPDPTVSICGECVARLPEYHAVWWRDRCGLLASELIRLQDRNGDLQKECNRYRERVSTPVAHARPSQKGKQHREGAKRSRGGAKGPIAERRRLVPPPPVKTTPDPEKVRRRIREMNAPRPTKSQEERWADEAAADRMRSQKPSTWRIGGSPSSYGHGI